MKMVLLVDKKILIRINVLSEVKHIKMGSLNGWECVGNVRSSGEFATVFKRTASELKYS